MERNGQNSPTQNSSFLPQCKATQRHFDGWPPFIQSICSIRTRCLPLSASLRPKPQKSAASAKPPPPSAPPSRNNARHKEVDRLCGRDFPSSLIKRSRSLAAHTGWFVISNKIRIATRAIYGGYA